MNTKTVNTPIGSFNSFYSSLGLSKLIFIGKRKSKYNKDMQLQTLVDQFFSTAGLNESPVFDLSGTVFQLKVWEWLLKIPRGRTESYSSLATKIGHPRAARAVGTACKLNPVPLFIPCHRVLKQDKTIGEFALGKRNKKYLLDMETK